jgi:general secretion pathway protein G
MSLVAMEEDSLASPLEVPVQTAEPAPRRVRNCREAGVTLIEMLVVVTIIGLIVGIVGIQVFRYLDRAKVSTAKTQIKTFEDQLQLYRTDVGSFPTTAQGLQALRTRPEGVDQWQGPYAAHDIPLDPWGHPYGYVFPGEHCAADNTADTQNQTEHVCEEPDIVSFGADGQPGGDGINADIVSWK